MDTPHYTDAEKAYSKINSGVYAIYNSHHDHTNSRQLVMRKDNTALVIPTNSDKDPYLQKLWYYDNETLWLYTINKLSGEVRYIKPFTGAFQNMETTTNSAEAGRVFIGLNRSGHTGHYTVRCLTSWNERARGFLWGFSHGLTNVENVSDPHMPDPDHIYDGAFKLKVGNKYLGVEKSGKSYRLIQVDNADIYKQSHRDSNFIFITGKNEGISVDYDNGKMGYFYLDSVGVYIIDYVSRQIVASTSSVKYTDAKGVSKTNKTPASNRVFDIHNLLMPYVSHNLVYNPATKIKLTGSNEVADGGYAGEISTVVEPRAPLEVDSCSGQNAKGEPNITTLNKCTSLTPTKIEIYKREYCSKFINDPNCTCMNYNVGANKIKLDAFKKTLPASFIGSMPEHCLAPGCRIGTPWPIQGSTQCPQNIQSCTINASNTDNTNADIQNNNNYAQCVQQIAADQPSSSPVSPPASGQSASGQVDQPDGKPKTPSAETPDNPDAPSTNTPDDTPDFFGQKETQRDKFIKFVKSPIGIGTISVIVLLLLYLLFAGSRKVQRMRQYGAQPEFYPPTQAVYPPSQPVYPVAQPSFIRPVLERQMN